jgi:hypothetical protein
MTPSHFVPGLTAAVLVFALILYIVGAFQTSGFTGSIQKLLFLIFLHDFMYYEGMPTGCPSVCVGDSCHLVVMMASVCFYTYLRE